MGLSVGQFTRLVASWKAHGDAVRVSGSNRRRGASIGTSALPAATRAAIVEAIAAMGTDAGFQDIRREAARRCLDAGTPEASEGMVHYLLMRARRDTAPKLNDDCNRLLIGHVEVLLPIAKRHPTTDMPTLLLAVAEAGRRIVAHRLVIDDASLSKAAHSILREVQRTRAADRDATIVVAGDLPIASSAAFHREGGPRLLAAILGSHLDTLPLRHQRRRAGEVRRAPGKPITRSDALAAVAAAVAAHNSRVEMD